MEWKRLPLHCEVKGNYTYNEQHLKGIYCIRLCKNRLFSFYISDMYRKRGSRHFFLYERSVSSCRGSDKKFICIGTNRQSSRLSID